MPPERKVIMIAGPNGAGKTTFALEYLPYEPVCPTFVNADLIAAGVSPLAPEAAAFRAGRLMLEEIERHASQRRSFALKTALSGLAYARRIRQWRSSGYVVKVTCPSPRPKKRSGGWLSESSRAGTESPRPSSVGASRGARRTSGASTGVS